MKCMNLFDLSNSITEIVPLHPHSHVVHQLEILYVGLKKFKLLFNSLFSKLVKRYTPLALLHMFSQTYYLESTSNSNLKNID